MGGMVCLFRRVKNSDERWVKKKEESRGAKEMTGSEEERRQVQGRMKERPCRERAGFLRLLLPGDLRDPSTTINAVFVGEVK